MRKDSMDRYEPEIRKMARRMTAAQIANMLQINVSAVYKVARRNGISFSKVASKQIRPADIPLRTHKTRLDMAVETLRRVTAPVCAEDTIRRPHVTPKHYTQDTVFRVGDIRNVPAERVIEMAGI